MQGESTIVSGGRVMVVRQEGFGVVEEVGLQVQHWECRCGMEDQGSWESKDPQK